MIVPVVLQVVMMAMPAYANEVTDGLAESGCTLDEQRKTPQQQANHRVLKVSGCQIEGRVDTSLPFISMSVHGVVNDELGIVSDGKYHKVSGEYFIVSDIVNRDMELDLRVNNGVLFYPNNTALFELNYM
ncbi:TPA: hypothetical protein RVR74_000808 [Aeromonas salmonicida]|uniref:hypothetical protein n=1 Tax=Aeromonas salmonicida TaxID=645 RepID=UPI001C5F8629|nr:hypothetical protein [Aeromonas salmonicida]MDF8328444.1 hypothetical protein [Aeromonas salmonicida]MDM5136815.1 hypothetical protein [Aeromonas salmonicida]WHF43227.1 hypothetical protein QJ050_14145 [Aeromonas salmonicida]HEA3088527.1 hypothetical protein [Aeromonas salmonicida]